MSKTGLQHLDRIRLLRDSKESEGVVVGVCDDLLLVQFDGHPGAIGIGPATRRYYGGGGSKRDGLGDVDLLRRESGAAIRLYTAPDGTQVSTFSPCDYLNSSESF